MYQYRKNEDVGNEEEGMSPEKLLTLEQVAERLAVSRKMVYDWIRDGRIPGVKMGRLWRVKEGSLDAFIDSLEPIKPGDDPRCADRNED
jgi:excisionase family DNA binding protein